MSVVEVRRANIVPSGKALGATVEGIDLASPSDSDVGRIRDALHAHLVVRLRAADLDDVAFTRLAERFGTLEGSPDYSRSRNVYVAESPLMTVVSNVSENGKAVGDHGDGELNWHTDLGFTDRPSGYTFLLAREVPPSGGNTSFANMYNAYERLPEATKTAIARLKLKHQESHTAQGIPRPGYRDIRTSDPRELPGPQHPIVRTHPVTGRKCLFVNRGFTKRIEGLRKHESEALLELLIRHCETPEFQCRFRWEKHSVAFWDNRCAMHRATFDYYPHLRHGHRVTIKGDRPF